LEYKLALAFREERLDPGNQVSGDTSSGEDRSQLVCADVVKSTFDIQEESRYREGSGLKQADFVGESSDSVKTAQTGQGPSLIGVQEAKGAGGRGETKSRKSFEDFGDGLEQDNDAKGSRCMVIGFAWFIQDNAVGLLHGYGVVPMGEKSSEQRWKKPLVGLMDLLPDRVRNTAWARG